MKKKDEILRYLSSITFFTRMYHQSLPEKLLILTPVDANEASNKRLQVESNRMGISRNGVATGQGVREGRLC